MILAGNVGSQGGIQNGYMYAILFGAVSAVRSSLLKPTLFLWATKGIIVKERHCVMSECWMLQSWMPDVICWNSEPMIDKLWALEDVKFRSLNILCCAGHCWAHTTHIWWQGSEWSWGQVSRPACTWRYPFFGSGLNLSSSHMQVSPETWGSHRLCWSKWMQLGFNHAFGFWQWADSFCEYGRAKLLFQWGDSDSYVCWWWPSGKLVC